MIEQRKIVIIGSSIAGITAADSARKQDPEAVITVVSRDTRLPYYRLRLCEVIDNPAAASQMTVHPVEWYEERRIALLLGVVVNQISPLQHEIHLADGRMISYDALVIAAGSQSFVPPIPGIQRPGIYTLWSLDDALQIEAALHQAKRALVIGGGLLGLEAAYHIQKKGIQSTVVEKLPRLLANQLDENGSIIFSERVKKMAVTVLTDADIIAFEGMNDGDSTPVSRVILKDQTVIEADFVLVSIGVRALSELAREAGITIGRRILTDEAMRTSAVDIFAAGDVAEPLEYWFGLWSSAKEQGNVAGINAAGGKAVFERAIPPYVINTMDTRVAVQGDKGMQIDPSYKIDVQMDKTNGIYRKLVYRDGLFCGFILVGDTREFSKLQKAIGEPEIIT